MKIVGKCLNGDLPKREQVVFAMEYEVGKDEVNWDNISKDLMRFLGENGMKVASIQVLKQEGK